MPRRQARPLSADLQGRLARNLPATLGSYLDGLDTDAQRALQFVRSTPGMGTALVGMKRVAHVEENARVARTPPVPPDTLLSHALSRARANITRSERGPR